MSRPTAAGAPELTVPGRPARAGRLGGIDVARGLAILGMFVAHLGDDGPDGEHDPAWFVVADGRSAALFAVLAGVSLALSYGRRTPPAALALVRARLAVFVRAAVLLVIGVFLVALGTPVLVILPAYAATFALATPFLGLARRWVLTAAAVVVVVSPTVLFLLTTPTAAGDPSPLARLTGMADPVELPMDVFVTGAYPALVYLAYVLAGLAVGRSDLARTRTQLVLVGAGAGLAALGWGTSRLGLDALGPDAAPLTRRLLSAEAHDDSTLEVLGNCGTSLAVIGLCLLATTAPVVGRAARAVLAPVAAAGALSLTVYSVHIVAIFLLGNDVVWYPESNAVLGWFVLVALAGAWLWRRFLGRGPLERLVRGAVRAVVPPLGPGSGAGPTVPAGGAGTAVPGAGAGPSSRAASPTSHALGSNEPPGP
ncbi:DUF1624 domain-containing protein [Georgenia sp. TF02-10]|uniref:heparan-alpha-glucosaminide N-acetyltransferase domain-containing protein n=1 Tax=Georgenia sp. TF02-10 TaxID=2917725 RepID=UPI001FA7E78C|nr:heparan-alpha-glucosaminide N-acetyltransferase domain-containing protein [Georgenia sp. TF02-10]UNX53884.1 DUF1624 domain-containing protein [Georgenia sp. TF02-10]